MASSNPKKKKTAKKKVVSKAAPSKLARKPKPAGRSPKNASAKRTAVPKKNETPKKSGALKVWISTGVMVAVLAVLAGQVFWKAKKQASMNFPMNQVGRIISQGSDVNQSYGVGDMVGDKQDNLFVIEGVGTANNRLQKYDATQNSVAIYSPKDDSVRLDNVRGIDVGMDGKVYVYMSKGLILVLDNNFKFLKKFQVQSGGGSMAVDALGRVIISNRATSRVYVYGADGKRQAEIGGGAGPSKIQLAHPKAVRSTADGRLVILESLPTGLRVKVLNKTFKLLKQFDISDIQDCTPLHIGINKTGVAIINDHLGSNGVVFYDLDSGEYVGQSQITKGGVKFISPGSSGANKFTLSYYVHTVPGLIKSRMPSGGGGK